MPGDIVGLQQIVITFLFLSVLVGVLIFLRRKGSFIRANLHKDKRIQLVEETAISPSEKLRLVSIDGQMFVMASAKGVQPVLTSLGSVSNHHAPAAPQADFGADFGAHFTAQASQAPAEMVSPLELTQAVSGPASGSAPGTEAGTVSGTASKTSPKAASGRVDAADIRAFQEKFKSWRQR